MKGSRSGVGSLIRGKASYGRSYGKLSSTLFVLANQLPDFIASCWQLRIASSRRKMRSSTKHSYSDLMEDFRLGGEDAFNSIFHDLYQALYFYGNKITGDPAVSEEIAAASFLKVWERRIEFQHFLSLKSYLYTTVRNASIDWLRKNQREAKARMGMVSVLDVTERTRLEQLVIAETYRELYAGINKLPAQCRQIITMIFMDGKSTKEIAKELNITVDNIRVQKARGLKLLRQSVHHLHFFSAFILFILYNFL